MPHSSRLLAVAAMAALGSLSAQVSAGFSGMMRAGRELLPAPARPARASTGLPGMGHGTKVRGNRHVQRMALKKRNQARHRRACR